MSTCRLGIFQSEFLHDLEFAVARGTSGRKGDIEPAAMTKWFDTNYHYIVPELGSVASAGSDDGSGSADSVDPPEQFTPDATILVEEAREARELGFKPKPVLSVGIVNGRNVWRNNLEASLAALIPVYESLGDRLWIAPSCSLLHVPVDTAVETQLAPEVREVLAFADQKLHELSALKQALEQGEAAIAQELEAYRRSDAALESQRGDGGRGAGKRDDGERGTEARLASEGEKQDARRAPYAVRRQLQRHRFSLPQFPTTTIGSFPQTDEIRKARRARRKGEIEEWQYTEHIRAEIEHAVRIQEDIGLDVLVHGEAERTDMVEYFGRQLGGFAFTENGWVQSYGTRCVKPPIIYGEVHRPEPMTVFWTAYAQSLTERPVKGMLTGPITILQWSFVREDQPRRDTAMEIAKALRDEVHDLEQAGIGIIQVDEPALREGLPLRNRFGLANPPIRHHSPVKLKAQWKVIRGATGERAPMHPGAYSAEVCCHPDSVQRQQRCTGGKGASGYVL